MDIQPQSSQATQPISDDQDLAKALAGITQENNNLKFEETPPPPGNPTEVPAVSNIPQLPVTQYTPPELSTPAPTEEPQIDMPAPVTTGDDLEPIKKQALLELRPLVDKLNLAPEEKFDIYLLLLRSTDDKTLIDPAHEAAKNIMDESRRAQALLDIIKEIDYLSNSQQAASI